MCWSVCCDMGMENTTQYLYTPGIVWQATTTLGDLIYARTVSIYDVLCASELGVLGFHGVLFT